MAIVCFASPASFADTTDELISDSKQKISDNKKRMQEIKNEKSGIQKKINELSDMKDDVSKYISELDGELDNMDKKIVDYNSEIDELNSEIETTKAELEEAERIRDEQYLLMKKRIKYIYENGNINDIDSMLKSRSFSEMLNKAEYIRRVSDYDRDKLNEFIAIKNAVDEKKEELVSQQEVVKEAKEAAEENRQEIAKLQEEKKAELQSYEEKINAANADVNKLQGSINSLQAAIKAEENAIAAIEAEIRRKEEEARLKAIANGEKYEPLSIGDISFTWPIPGCTRITSQFGDREAPVAGASTNHKGIDISASTGTKVIAAASGTIVISTYSASAGNYVMVSHGGGIYTVYMHLSKISVAVGDSVTRGQQLGLAGSTGYSTGPHLHFGVRINGNYVNPLVYVAP